ncbi:MAG TPA: hypothetical protein VHR18_09265 [Solirubrobacterales bacterium]|nr:hypothetical protein [Solirubrobacterales bacterium]
MRLDLEAMLGGTVAPAFAAKMLGVSHTALNRWIEREEVPVVLTPSGRRGIPISSLGDLWEAIERQRRNGGAHVLEAAVFEARDRADKLRSQDLIRDGESTGDAGRASELRSLAYHRAVARRLDRKTAEMALALVRYWAVRGSIDSRYAAEWEQILEGPLAGVRKAMEDEGPRGRDLRQNSPFAGLLSEAERRAIATEIG